ncbi:MAG: chorismate synthase [Bacteroidales bacterium]|nr:chorismate synthase [Bacteroidales bacterium]
MNTFGRIFKVSIFGESHGPKLGITLDGVPEGMELNVNDFSEDIARRASGAPGTTARHEADVPEIVSGVYEGHTTGAPLTILFDNADTHPDDYSLFDEMPRPGHADYVASVKWDWANDPRGGGHFSGRLTLPIVAAGVVAKKILEGISFDAKLIELGGCGNRLKWPGMLEAAAAEGDSLGGVVECVISGLPIGLGEPFFDSVESLISHAMFSIPGVRGIEFGDGFAAARMKGSEHNDPFGPEGPVKNGSGGANGGITNGAPLLFRVAFKPTSSISKPQKTYNFKTERMDTLKIPGRHDTCFAQRTPVIVESMAAIVLADLI